jgi:inorganic pyrophosphatase/exopolyphosphatase
MSIIVTSGEKYLDIDAYASMVACAELIGGKAVSTALLNESVVDEFDRVERNYVPNDSDEFIVLDTSDPATFDRFVGEDQIVEIIDHHFGFEEYWKEKGIESQIEEIGAVATIIWERWRDAGKLGELTRASGRLLMEGILDNTLNFLAGVSGERDKNAYEDLAKRFGDIREWYFKTVEAKILNDLENSLKNDFKTIDFKSLGSKLNFYQLAVWDVDKVLERQNEILRIIGNDSLLNLISISKGKSQIIASNKQIQTWAENLMKGQDLFLRKELIRKDLGA